MRPLALRFISPLVVKLLHSSAHRAEHQPLLAHSETGEGAGRGGGGTGWKKGCYGTVCTIAILLS